MERVDPQSLRIEFSRRVEVDKLRLFQHRQHELLEQKQQHVEDRIMEDDFWALAQIIVEAAAKDIAAFDTKLTHYEALTTAEIMRLQEQFDDLIMQRDEMLERAYILPDGRRVFKTEDGLRVFDEDGNEVDHDLVDPDLIESSRPTWEKFSGVVNMIAKTEQQLQELHEFQSKLDDIRERFDQGEITAEELKTLEKELERSVPLSLRAHDTALNIEDTPANATPEFTAAANIVNKVDINNLELDVPDLSQQ